MKPVLLTAGAATAAALLLPALALPAQAHVSVTPNTAPPGGYATVSLRVPTERDDASTTRVEVVLPETLELSSLSTRPVPGWTATVRYRPGTGGEQVPSGIVWTGGQIKPNEFQAFDVSMGRLPAEPGALSLKALQTYSSGEVVRWIETPVEGAAEPDHPAPTLTLSVPAAEAAPAAAAPAANEPDGLARGLGAGGLAAGLAAVAVAARRRRPSRTTASVAPDARTPERVGR